MTERVEKVYNLNVTCIPQVPPTLRLDGGWQSNGYNLIHLSAWAKQSEEEEDSVREGKMEQQMNLPGDHTGMHIMLVFPCNQLQGHPWLPTTNSAITEMATGWMGVELMLYVLNVWASVWIRKPQWELISVTERVQTVLTFPWSRIRSLVRLPSFWRWTQPLCPAQPKRSSCLVIHRTNFVAELDQFWLYNFPPTAAAAATNSKANKSVLGDSFSKRIMGT